jgi:formylglycine-generating enzyme
MGSPAVMGTKIRTDRPGYLLPTEAEWEYTCRTGRAAGFPFGDDVSLLGEYAWFNRNSGMMIHPVGKKQPNAWGLL